MDSQAVDYLGLHIFHRKPLARHPAYVNNDSILMTDAQEYGRQAWMIQAQPIPRAEGEAIGVTGVAGSDSN
jgi:hypothetical protein